MSIIRNYNEDEIMPSRKKKKKSIQKSNHKHQYVDCLINWDGHYHKAQRCSVCGKINNIRFFETEPYKPGYSKILNKNDILKKYETLEKYNYPSGEKI